MILRRKLWLVWMIAALLMGACTSGDSGDGGDGGGTTEEGGDPIEVAAVWTGTEQERFTAVLDAFTEETGIETSFRSSGDDMAAFLANQIKGKAPPDIAMIAQPALVAQLADEGSAVALNDDVVGAIEENFAPVWKDIGSVDGTPYALYFKVANKSTWWYNTSIFEQAGVEPPSDWDAMLESASTVNASGTPWV